MLGDWVPKITSYLRTNQWDDRVNPAQKKVETNFELGSYLYSVIIPKVAPTSPVYKSIAPTSCRVQSMSPLHINMTNAFHTGRPRGSLTTPTSVTNTARPLSSSRSFSDLLTKLKRILAKYAGFVGPGILISIAYMVNPPFSMATNVVGSRELFHGCFCRGTISVQTPLYRFHLQYFRLFLAIISM